MTDKQRKDLTKQLVESSLYEKMGSTDQKMAFAELKELEKLNNEVYKDVTNVEQKELDREIRKEELNQRAKENETNAKFREKELEQKRQELELRSKELEIKLETEKASRELEEKKMKHQHRLAVFDTIGKIGVAVLGGVGTIIGVAIGYNKYNEAIDKVLTFEQTGVVSSQTGKKVMGDLTKPKI